MRIDTLLARGSVSGAKTFSFELYPPRTPQGERELFAAVEGLLPLRPAFVSITCGAGGKGGRNTLELCARLKATYGIEAMAHVTCLGQTREALRRRVGEVLEAGFDNILALRGDAVAGQTPEPGTLRYASELVTLIREQAGRAVSVGAACYPEKHAEAESAEADLSALREKVAAGVDFLITQLFFDNQHYFRFLDRARAAGIRVPIVPGLMPITDVGQIERMTERCGTRVPASLSEALHAYCGSSEATLNVGVAYATLQCSELLHAAVPGIHFFTLNRSPATRAVLAALRTQEWRAVA